MANTPNPRNIWDILLGDSEVQGRVLRGKGKRFIGAEAQAGKIMEEVLRSANPKRKAAFLEDIRALIARLGGAKRGSNEHQMRLALEKLAARLEGQKGLPPVAGAASKAVGEAGKRVIPMGAAQAGALPAAAESGSLGSLAAEAVKASRVGGTGPEAAVAGATARGARTAADMFREFGGRGIPHPPTDAGTGRVASAVAGARAAGSAGGGAYVGVPHGREIVLKSAADAASLQPIKRPFLEKVQRGANKYGPGILTTFLLYSAVDQLLGAHKQSKQTRMQADMLEKIMKNMDLSQSSYMQQMMPLEQQRAMGAEAMVGALLARGEERIGG